MAHDARHAPNRVEAAPVLALAHVGLQLKVASLQQRLEYDEGRLQRARERASPEGLAVDELLGGRRLWIEFLGVSVAEDHRISDGILQLERLLVADLVERVVLLLEHLVIPLLFLRGVPPRFAVSDKENLLDGGRRERHRVHVEHARLAAAARHLDAAGLERQVRERQHGGPRQLDLQTALELLPDLDAQPARRRVDDAAHGFGRVPHRVHAVLGAPL
mmetsp:Transcript_6139/g.18313  ORF Transcript_6139/g.18313 Transcript_6139/m.18313 type:complete len:218 (-) Transcript_6139:574-1227(-)